MSKKWREIRRDLGDVKERELQARVEAEVHRIESVTKLDQLRRARALSQVQLAEQMGLGQGAVSRIERQSDLYLSTLRRFVQAMGGRLHIVAEFENADPITLDLFGDIVKKTTPARRKKPA